MTYFFFFFYKSHLQRLPAKEAEPLYFSLQHAESGCKMAPGVGLSRWRCTTHDKCHTELYVAASVCKDSQLPILKKKIMLPMVFLSFYFSGCYEPMSLISCMSVNVQKCRCSKKLENTNPQIPKPRKKLNYTCSPDVCLAFCFHLTLYPTRII